MLELNADLIDELDEDESSSLATWALNFVLGLLGATVLFLAFTTLDRDDARYLYNPWTYAVVVPIVLVMLSAVMSTLVSRVVRRSMQAAFLLSVLAHLLILTYFSNIVIHSRLWPQLFDSFAQQRQQLKKEALQAKQYVKMSVTTQPNRRADHMRPVPTNHSPTEIPKDEERKIQLAKSEVNQLVSPRLELEKATTPHLLKRSESQRSTPSFSPKAAELSRSELSQASPEPNAGPTYEIFQSEPQLQASKADQLGSRTRQSKADSALASPTNLTPEPERANRDTSKTNLLRKATNDFQVTEIAAAADLPLRNSLERQPTPSRQPISTPSTLADLSADAPSLTAESQAAKRSSSKSSASRSLDLVAPSAADSALATNSPLKRNQTEQQVPNPTDGASSLSMARSSAGGDAGPAARSSLPTQGSDVVASQSNASSELRIGSNELRRNSRGNQAAATPQLPEIGSASSPQWDGATSVAGGIASRSPAQLAREVTGDANSTDVAGMFGAGGDIQRAAVGIAGPQGRLSVLAGPNGFGENAEPANLEAGASQARRSSGNSKTSLADLPSADAVASIGGAELSKSAANQSLPSGLQQRSSDASSGLASNNSPSSLERSFELAGGAPKTGKIDTPNLELGGMGDSTGNPIIGSAGAIQRTKSEGRNSRLQIPLDIDASPGDGGMGLVANQDPSPLLPRRESSEIKISLPEFDVQKFARSDVGGPLGGGTNVAVPTPAFQQRLDRLENPSADSSVDPRTELAIERGLEFLAKYQRTDGSWRLQDFDTNVLIRSDTAATALALLAFQGAGYTHVQSKYAPQVSRAIEFLANHQKENGDLYIPQDPASDQNGWLYSHAIASLALCEAYGMTQDERLKPVAQRAINFMVSSQDPRRGGWRYRPENGSDTSVTGWYMMALQSGRLSGLNVPSKTFDSIKSFVERAQYSEEEPHIYRYNPFAPDTPEQRHGLQPTAVMTSVGLLIRLYSGWQRENKAMMDGATYLLIHSPQNGTKQQSRRDTYYWYYATQVIFHMGGDYWKRWQDTLNPMLINEQVLEGRYAGSWDPNEPVPDLWAKYGGRLYVTTMNLLSLEVSYRHLPLYEATSK